VKGMKKKRHSPEEIITKLRQAGEMLAQGKLHSEVAKALGVSIMTYHRWRKARASTSTRRPVGMMEEARVLGSGEDLTARMAALQLENSRLRRLVTDLLLEKVRLEESLGGKKSGTGGQ